MAAASISVLCLGFIAFLAVPLLGGVRWWLALRGLGHQANLPELTALFSTASVVGQVLPSVAGDTLRVVLASRRRYNLRASLESVLLERVYMVLAVLTLAFVTSPLLAHRIADQRPVWISAGLLACGFAGFGLLLRADLAPSWIAHLRSWQALADGAATARGFAKSCWGARLAGVALISNLNFAVAALLLGNALHLNIGISDMLATMPAVTLATTVPISLGGWGVREGVLIFLLGRLGVPAAGALSLSLLFGFFGILSGFPGLLGWIIGSHGQRVEVAPGDASLTRTRDGY
jgi:uncharacterized membrane protein YbhN (UPF0104 family)